VSFRRYFLLRLAWALIGIWIAATIVFLAFYVWGADPARQSCGGERASAACLERVRNELHTDARIPEQYVRFLWRLVSDASPGPTPYVEREGGPPLDSGELAREAAPATLSLVVPALLLAAVVGTLAGTSLARVRWRRIFDLPIYVAFGLFPTFLSLVLLIYVGVEWGVAPIANYCDFFRPPKESGCGGAIEWATHLILPVIALSLYFAAVYTRVVRALAVQVRSEEDPEKQRKRRRRSSLLFGRSVGRDFGFAVGLAMFVEQVFVIPGLGYSTIQSIYADSLVETQACLLYATLLAISVQFVVDVVVGALDPGLRWERPVARRPKPA
jgi:peptide/nickel transport system permease protein